MKEYVARAYGKINLGLDVTGIYPNGYHQVKMVMQTVGLHDTLHFKRINENAVRLDTNDRFLPTDGDNLIVRAVNLIKESYGIKDGVEIYLEKRLPVAAGMAGGSSDAAAALRAMSEMFQLKLEADALGVLGKKLGADIPYCIHGGTMLAEGIGEILTPLKSMPECDILLVKPPIAVSTPSVYKALDKIAAPPHPDVDGIMKAIDEGNAEKLCKRLGNILEMVTVTDYPVIGSIKEAMLGQGACGALMSGSGPTVFGIFTDSKKAAKAYEYFKETEFATETLLTGPVNPEYGQAGKPSNRG